MKTRRRAPLIGVDTIFQIGAGIRRARHALAQVAGGVDDRLGRDELVAHRAPVRDELVVGLRLAARAHAIELVPDLRLLEDLRLLVVGEATNEGVGDVDGLVDEGCCDAQ